MNEKEYKEAGSKSTLRRVVMKASHGGDTSASALRREGRNQEEKRAPGRENRFPECSEARESLLVLSGEKEPSVAGVSKAR